MPLYALGGRSVTLRGAGHFVADTAAVLGSVVLEDRVSVWYGVTIRADNDHVHVGEGSNIQDGAVLHVDPGIPLTLGRHVTVGHKAMLHGCTVGDGALIGMSSVVLNGARIGAGTLIGANTLIPEGKVFPEGVLVLGQPGKVVRELRPEERARILEIAEGYIQRAAAFRRDLRRLPDPE